MTDFLKKYKDFKNEQFHNNLQLVAIVLIFLFGHAFTMSFVMKQGFINYAAGISLGLTIVYLFVFTKENIKKNIFTHSIFKEINYSNLSNDDVILLHFAIEEYPAHYCRVILEERSKQVNNPLYIITEDQLNKIKNKMIEKKIDLGKSTQVVSLLLDLAIYKIISEK